MSFKISQDRFEEALTTVGRAIPAKTTLPVLTGILIEGEGDHLVLRATDMNTEIQLSVEAAVVNPVAIVLPRTLIEVVRRLPSGEITVEVDPKNHTATIMSGRSRYILHGFSPEMFPQPMEGGDLTLTIPAAVLRDLITKTAISVGNDESKPHLSGVHFRVKGTELTATATNGVRVSHVKVEIHNPNDIGAAVIVPGRSLSDLGKVLGKTDADVAVSLGANTITFAVDDLRVSSRLLEGQYPDVMRVVPTSYPLRATFNRGEMIDCLERASLVSKDAIKLVMKPGIDSLIIQAEKAEAGKGNEEIPVRFEGEGELTISFNPAYILAGLSQLDGTDVSFEFIGPRDPARMVSTNVRGVNFTYVALPLITL